MSALQNVVLSTLGRYASFGLGSIIAGGARTQGARQLLEEIRNQGLGARPA